MNFTLLVWLATVPPVGDDALCDALRDSLADTDRIVRMNAAIALAELGPRGRLALIESLRSTSGPCRAAAAYGLGLVGADASSALPQLTVAVKDADREVRRQATFAISRIVARRPAVVPIEPPPPDPYPTR